MLDTSPISKGSLGRKLIGLVLASLVTSFVVTALFATWTDLSRRAQLETDRLTQTAQVIGSLSADAVREGDRGAAFGAIRSVGQMSGVNYARLQTADGKLLAETGSGARLVSDTSVADDDAAHSLWSVLTTGSIQATAPVISRGETVGTITVFASTPDLSAQVLSTIWTTLAGAVIATLSGMLVAIRMARVISGPIVALARVVRGVGQTGDYSRPAEIAAEGEVADLVAGFNTMLEGIRERDRRIADHVEGLERTVAARTAELSLAKDAAETANAAKSDFLAVMSHEIRTPMNGILALSDMLAKSDLPARQQRYAEVIAKSGQSLLSIINDILDFSKVEAGKMDLEAIEVDLAEVAEDVASLFSEKAGEKGLDLAVFVHPSLPSVLADPVRLRQVVGNLVNNAIKFTEEGGVLIAVDRDPADPARLKVSIEDTGPGIPADKLPTLFEAFTQADQSTTRKYGGTGLGLAICDRLVRSMGGEWQLSSEVGVGSVFAFSVDLPAVTATEPRPAPQAGWSVSVGQVGRQTREALGRYLKALGVTEAEGCPAAFVPVGQGQSGPMSVLVCEDEASAANVPADACPLVKPLRRIEIMTVLDQMAAGARPALSRMNRTTVHGLTFPSARVLVVDDSEVNREVAAEALGRLGIVPTLVEDGVEAVEILRVQAFDLVLMDGSMPNLDGFEATRIIRAEEVESGRDRTVIVALTAHVVGSGADAWKTCGMDGVVHKPFTVDDLGAVLTKFCGEMAVTGPVVLLSDTPTEPAAETASVPVAAAVDETLFDPVIRAELAAMAAQGRGDFVERVQGLYATNAPLRLADLKAAETADHAEDAARAAHALKSMSLSLGARAVAAEASRIETAARAGEPIAGSAAAIGTLMIRTLSAMGAATGTSAPAKASALDDLTRGIAKGELHLAYQKLIDRSGVPSGKVEALVRWTHSERGRLSPDDFIPTLEAEGAISTLTDFVLTRAMRDLADRPDIRVSVNSSATEFQEAGFAARIAAVLTREAFPAHRLEVEVTETAMLDVEAARRTIDALALIGVGVALDDFGAGYTSLHALRELKFTTLKVDRSFVERCTDDTASASIIHAVIGVGRALGMKVVCEGIETAAQADFLRIAGAHYLQGYHFHRPCAADQLDLPMANAA